MVGFKEEAEEFINFLNDATSKKLDIASIVGMAGLGKTTLTWNIFEDPKIEYEFPDRIWVNVSDSLNMENVLLTILKHFTTTETPPKYEDLLEKVKGYLKKGKFLIVLDDIWTTSAWEKIKQVLPLENDECKVLVTTRTNSVGEAATTRGPHYLRFLSPKESWQLLKNVVYEDNTDVSSELEGVGKVISKDCDGLPLSIVVMGGVFPEDASIPVKEIIRLWIAEGFILEKRGMSMEQVALENLNDFINRNLVMVKKEKPNGEPKLCQIHDSVREICREKANYKNLNLFQEITRSDNDSLEPHENVEKFRRLCIHSYVVNIFKKLKKVPKARSFLCFHPSPIFLLPESIGSITDGFDLLRVYNAKNIIFPRCPLKLLQLIHLRYLTLIMENCTTLPESISELLNLPTLIVDMSSKTIDIKTNIWKMRQLRHLKTKASIILKIEGRNDGCENLQTLSRLSPESCTKEVFEKAKNLITLGIQGELNKLAITDGLSNLDHLLKLKLVNQVPNGVASEHPLRRLPELQNFPPNLKVLVVSGTYMHWSKMLILSQLGSLKVLKLKENAFNGNNWEAVYVFPHLEILHIERLQELVSWKAEQCPFPKLKFLSVKNCENLIEVPDRVCEKVETLYMERVARDAVISAEEIKKHKKDNGVVFKLDIAPADRLNQKP